MSLVHPSDFIIDINIPNTDETAVQATLQGFIDKYEPIYLKQLLGLTLYPLFIAGIGATPPIDAKWQALKDAITIEQIASFVYWYFVRKQSSYLSGLNITVRPTSENAESIGPIRDMVDVWNGMVDMNYQTAKFIQDNNADYGNYYNQSVLHAMYYFVTQYGCVPDIFYKQNTFGL